MSNDPKTDLIYAILAMDSYNRGYGFGITDLPSSGKIGSYQITRQSDVQVGSTARTAGFYAIAYKNAATDETVISYRGTDVKYPFYNSSSTMGGSDVDNGYGIATGHSQSPQFLPLHALP